ncbi:hypothetical protein FACS1894216_18000 [Synergistales bacterium]|nr:hypothetical protein FACS1894216_18000 [Synergistales bacterium]
MNFVYKSTPVNTSTEKKYKEFYAENNPTVIGETETTRITVNSVLPLSGESWQAEWTEERYTLTGAKLSAKNYRGIFATAVASPTEMREVLVNPLGIFITDFNLSELSSNHRFPSLTAKPISGSLRNEPSKPAYIILWLISPSIANISKASPHSGTFSLLLMPLQTYCHRLL